MPGKEIVDMRFVGWVIYDLENDEYLWRSNWGTYSFRSAMGGYMYIFKEGENIELTKQYNRCKKDRKIVIRKVSRFTTCS